MDKRLFAIGDIHGCFEKFQTLVEQKILLKKEDHLVLLGDYIDRGPQSKEVIDYILNLQKKAFSVTPLMGNHEDMLLNAYRDASNISLWFMNGGVETMRSFGIQRLEDLDETYVRFFKSLPHFYQIEQYLFVHAGFNDEAEDPFEDKFHMLWKSHIAYNHPLLIDKTIVHGHTAIKEAYCRERLKTTPQVIDIDTGCVYDMYPGYGKLTAIELNSKTLFSV